MLLIVTTPINSAAQTAHFSYSQVPLPSNFIAPRGGAVDANGNYYVADGGYDAIKMIPYGCSIPPCIQTLVGGLSYPFGVALDGAGNIFVVEQGSRVIREIPPGCTNASCAISLGGGLSYPSGIALDKNGNVFVGDSGNGAVKEIPPGCFDSSCVITLASGFGFPGGVAVDSSGNVFVADAYGTVSEIPYGCSNCVVTLASLTYAFGLTIDPSGNLFVAAENNPTIYEFLAATGYTRVIQLGSFSNPQGLTVDTNGNIFVADVDTNTVSKLSTVAMDFGPTPFFYTAYYATFTFTFDSGGTIANPSVVTEGATGLNFEFVGGGTCVAGSFNAGDTCTVDAGFVASASASPSHGAVLLKDVLGNTIASASLTAAGYGPQVTFLPGTRSVAVDTLGRGSTYDIALDGNGNFFVADYVAGTVNEIPVGCASTSCVKTLGSGFIHPYGIALDGAANVFVADADARVIYEILASGGYTNVVSLGSGFADPQSVALDGYGNLYVGDTGNNAVKELLASSGYSQSVTLGGGFHSPIGVAVDQPGNVYVSDYQNNAVKKIPPGCMDSSCVVTLGGGFTYPIGIAVDASGIVYVGDDGNSAIKEIVTALEPAMVVPLTNFGPISGFGLTLDPQGNIYVADTNLNQVVKLDVADPPTFTFPTPTSLGTLDITDGIRTAIVRNIGNAPLTLQPITPEDLVDASLTSSPSYDCLQMLGMQVPAGTACRLSFFFAPQAPGTNAGYIQLTDNFQTALGNTQRIGVSGTGVGSLTPAIMPVISPSYGTFTTPPSVTITDSSTGTSIFYTTDGSTPTINSTVYQQPFTASRSMTIKAIAAGGAYSASSVAVGGISIIATTPVINPTNGTFSGPTSVNITDSTPGASIYYTTDGSTPSTSSTQYLQPFTASQSMTIKAIAAGGNYAASSVAVGSVSILAGAPSFLPSSGSYSTPQTVKISDATAGVTIYYTIDGSAPSTSSPKNCLAPCSVTVSSTETIKAIAAGAGYGPSNVSFATYSFPTATPSFSLAAGTYNTSPLSVTITDTTPGATIYYSLNGFPTTSSPSCTSPCQVSVTSTMALRAIAVATGQTQSGTAVASYTIAAATPVLSPNPGTYAGPLTVTITETSPGTNIYYSLGGFPTTSSPSCSSPCQVSVAATTVVRTMAAGGSYSQSNTGFASYTIH